MIYNLKQAQRIFLGSQEVSQILLQNFQIFSSVSTDPYSDYVTLLAHFNTDFSDSSTNNFTLSAFGTTQISTLNKKFGSGSTILSSFQDYIAGPTSSEFSFDGNFTIEGWIYPTVLNSLQAIFSNIHLNAPINAYGITFLVGGNPLTYQMTLPNIGVFGSSLALNLNQWNHFALVRNNGAFYFFNNGIKYNSSINTTVNLATSGCFIGGRLDTTTYSTITNSFSGYIDDFRITKGIARYTENFTPPTSEFPNPSDPYGGPAQGIVLT